MAPKINLRKGGNARPAALYSVVFASKLSVLTVLLLMLSFLIQPFHKAAAAEPLDEPEQEVPGVAEEVKQQEVEEPAEEEQVVEPAQEEVEEPDEVVEDNSESANPEVETEDISDSENSNDDTDTASSTDTEEVQEESTDNETDDSETTPTTDTETETVNQAADVADNTTRGTSTASGEEDKVTGFSQAEEIAKETIRQIEYLVTDQNYYQFSRQSCVAVGNGSYHCSVNEGTEHDTDSVVYAEKGESGNLEIFIKTSKGKIEQITDNDYDDASPHYDPKSMRVVWHRLIDDRYQIVLYDIAAEEEYQLTFSRTNNMEPKVSVDGVVWQAWDGNDWEVMYFDGKFTDQITDNTLQDVSPVIEDNYILWSVLGGEEQEARVYSLEKGQTLTITGHEGGSIVNPRFVLVYDTKYENGDVVTQGFDPVTGLSAPIAAQPAPEPVDIPEVDPIGEVRALINNKSSHEDEYVPEDGGLSDVEASSTPIVTKATTSVDTLVLTPNTSDTPDTEQAVFEQATSSDDFVLTEYDLPIVFEDLSKLEADADPETLDISATSTQS